MVMGSCCSYTNLVRSIRPTNIFVQFVFTLLLLTTVHSRGRMRQCQIDKCSKDYRSSRSTTDVTEKCRLLSSHRHCLTQMKVSCRGNLLYHTSVHINKQDMKRCRCSSVLQTLSATTTEESVTNHSEQDVNSCSYAGKPKYQFCSLFGDPHVRTFSDKFFTCKANGSWPLINNDYLEVTATNTLLDGGMDATAISKLSVLIKESGDCAEQKTYTAHIQKPLPTTFDDGTTNTGLEESVKVSEIISGKEIQIDIRFIATTLVVRHVDSHLSFSVQMPAEIVDSPVDERLQMCVRGCPRSQRIPLSREIRRLTRVSPEFHVGEKASVRDVPKYSEQEARKVCRDALLQAVDVVPNTERSKRSAGKSSESRNPKRSVGNRQHRNVDIDPAATTWQQLSSGSQIISDVKSFIAPQYRRPRRRNKNHNRNNKKPVIPFGLMNDEPQPRSRTRGRGKPNKSHSIKRGANFYFEACVFDLMTTGDVMYTSSARGAFKDVTRFHTSGPNAPASSIDVVSNWEPETTTKPKTITTRAKLNHQPQTPKRIVENTTPGGAASSSHQYSSFVLIICLLSSILSINLIHAGTILGQHNLFFKRTTVKT